MGMTSVFTVHVHVYLRTFIHKHHSISIDLILHVNSRKREFVLMTIEGV